MKWHEKVFEDFFFVLLIVLAVCYLLLMPVLMIIEGR